MLPFATNSPTLSDFIVGENDEILNAVRALVEGKLAEPSIYLWGESGVGKSCLLKAACYHAKQLGVDTYYAEPPRKIIGIADDVLPPPMSGLLAVDDVPLLTTSAQITLFDWHNRAKQEGHLYLLASGDCAPTALTVRAELKTRLGGGLVFRLRPLQDGEKQQALAACAQRRGFKLPAAVADLLLSHLPRNMNNLEAALADLDVFLLAQQKPLTVRRVNKWLRGRLPPPIFLAEHK